MRCRRNTKSLCVGARPCARRLWSALWDTCPKFGARLRQVVGVGEPAGGILQAAHDLAADLIVVGTRGLGGLGRLMLGSVSRKVVRGASIPVLVARMRSPEHEMTPMRILAACETPETGRQTAAILNRFAWPRGSVGEVIHVVPSVVSHSDGVLSRTARARRTLARISSALAVQTNPRSVSL